MELEQLTIEQLSEIAHSAHDGNGSIDQNEANRLLLEFVEKPDSYLFAKDVLESDSHIYAKYTVLTALIQCIKKNWMVIEEDLKNEIRSFVFDFVMKNNDNPQLNDKASNALIAILNYEYPKKWPGFIDDVIQIEQEFWKNAINMLSLLFRHVKSSSSVPITRLRSSQMEKDIKQNKNRVISRISQILRMSIDSDLIKAALINLSLIVSWTYPFDLFKSDIFSELCIKFLSNPELALQVVGIISEIITNITFPEGEDDGLSQLFVLMVNSITTVSECEDMKREDHVLISFITALSTCFNHYGYIIDQPLMQEIYLTSLRWAWKITSESSEVLFELCIEFWVSICQRLYIQFKSGEVSSIYAEFAGNLRTILIERMASPYEVSITEDSYGITYRKIVENSSTGTIFSNMKTCLDFLMQVDSDSTIEALSNAYSIIEEETYQNIQRYQSFCFALSACANTFPKMSLIEILPGIIGSYFEKLKLLTDETMIEPFGIGVISICKYYRLVILSKNELFCNIMSNIIEIMRIDNHLLQEVCIDCIKYYSQLRGDNPLLSNPDENYPMYSVLCSNLFETFEKLSQDAIVTVFDLLMGLVSKMKNPSIQESSIKDIYELIANDWNNLVGQDLWDGDVCLRMVMSLNRLNKLPIHVCSYYKGFLSDISQSFIRVFLVISENCRSISNFNSILPQIAVKSSIVSHIRLFCSYYPSIEIFTEELFSEYIPIFLKDYYCNPPETRVRDCLDFFSTLSARLENSFESYYQDIKQYLIFPTILMIKDDYDSYHELRQSFFQMISTLTKTSKRYLNIFNDEELHLFVKTLKFGCKHPEPEISKNCLETLTTIFRELNEVFVPDNALSFLNTYCVSIVKFAFKILIDVTYKFALREISNLVFSIVKNQVYSARIEDVYREFIKIFSNQSHTFITSFIIDMINFSSEEQLYNSLKDFLITSQEISVNDPAFTEDEARDRIKEFQSMLKGAEINDQADSQDFRELQKAFENIKL